MLRLLDSVGITWQVTADSNGNLHADSTTLSGEFDTVYLTTIGDTASVWELGITTLGLLTADSVSSYTFTQAFIPLNDNWILRVNSLGLLVTSQRTLSLDARTMEPILEIQLDTVTERYAATAVPLRSSFWEPRVLSFGDITKSIPVVPGDFSSATFSVLLDNSDSRLSILRAQTPFFNRRVRLILLDVKRGELDMEDIFVGRITGWQFSGNSCELSISDDRLALLDSPLRYRISNEYFPELPDSTLRHLTPIVYGTVSSVGFSAKGAVPAYLIDPAIGPHGKYRYVAALGTLKSVDNVYLYGELIDPANYTVSQQVIGSLKYTVIDFNSDQRDASRKNEIEITYDAIGITEDGTTTGTPITNPARQYSAFLLLNGLSGVDLHNSSFDVAADLYDSKQTVGGVAIGGEAATVRDITLRFSESFNLNSFPSRDGRLAVSAPAPAPTDTSALLHFRDSIDIVEDSFRILPTDQIVNELQVKIAWNLASGSYDGSATFTDPIQQARQGGVRISTAGTLWYVRHGSSAAAVAQDRLFLMREERQPIGFNVDLSFFRRLDIGDDILVTHYEGIADTGNGYEAKAFRVIGVGLQISDQAILTTIQAVDLEPTVESTSAEYQTYGLDLVPIFTSAIGMEFQIAEQPLHGAESGFGSI